MFQFEIYVTRVDIVNADLNLLSCIIIEGEVSYVQWLYRSLATACPTVAISPSETILKPNLFWGALHAL